MLNEPIRFKEIVIFIINTKINTRLKTRVFHGIRRESFVELLYPMPISLENLRKFLETYGNLRDFEKNSEALHNRF